MALPELIDGPALTAVQMPRASSRVRYATVATLAVASLGLLTANRLLTTSAILAVPLIVWLTWRRGEPPILTFACLMQWLQASAGIFYTNWYGSSLQNAFGGPEIEWATWLSLIGSVSLAVGMRAALPTRRADIAKALAAETLQVYPSRVFIAYAISFVVSFIFAAVAFSIPAVTQILFALAAVKWAFVFMLAASVLEQRRGYWLLIVSVIAELIVGFAGYFAGFKNIFFVVAVAALASPRAFRGLRLWSLLIVAMIVVFVGTLWTAIKGDYREFLSEGFASQEVVAPMSERFGKLEDLISEFRLSDLPDAFEAMALRVSYVQYFALTMRNVPSVVPHENGALWLGAVKHVLTPRMFFPGKAAIDDSERTSFYTGLEVAGAELGTSIGIGYFAESYIDFGPVLMFAPILLLGVGYGLLYRAYVVVARHKLLGSGIVAVILIFGGSAIETSNIKIIGGNVMMVLIMGGLYALFGKTMMRWLAPDTAT